MIRREKAEKILMGFLLLVLGLWFAFPAYFTLQTSFLARFALIDPLRAIRYASLGNWRLLPWDMFFKWLKNSLIVCASVSVGGMLVAMMAGYGFAKYEFPLKEQMFWLFLLGMAVPSSLLFLPKYLIVRDLGLFNTYFGMIIPVLLGPAAVFLSRQYISKIPDDVIEAAKIDGASAFGVFRYIILPLSLPIVVLLIITGFTAVWGDFMWQLMVARDANLRTFTVGVGMFLQGSMGIAELCNIEALLEKGTSLEGLRAAASVLQATPGLILFVLGQKHFLKGLRIGTPE